MAVALLAGCDGQGSAVSDEGRDELSLTRPLSGPPALAEQQLLDFVTEIERLINGAAERVIAQGSRGSGTVDAQAVGAHVRRSLRGSRAPCRRFGGQS